MCLLLRTLDIENVKGEAISKSEIASSAASQLPRNDMREAFLAMTRTGKQVNQYAIIHI